MHAVWDTNLYSALLPELKTAASGFEYLYPLQDPLLGQIVTTLAQEIDGGFADRILIESLGTALCIGVARHFVGHLLLPTSGGLSTERLERVRAYVEAHLDDDLSLTVLADIACLSPYHFSRSFKQATGIGPQRYVMKQRLERAKRFAALLSSVPRLDCARGWVRRPEPSDQYLPPRDRRDTRPVPRRAGMKDRSALGSAFRNRAIMRVELLSWLIRH